MMGVASSSSDLTPPPRQLQNVGLVLTGGTIGSMITGQGDHEVVRLSSVQAGLAIPGGDAAWRQITQLRDVDFRVRRPIGLLSENLVPEDWMAIASAARDLVDEGVDGVLVLHGTDTMAYTSAALSFLLADVHVPVVLTGSNLPPDDPSSDAPTNVQKALIALPYLERGVFVVFAGEPSLDGWIHLGTRVRKARASGEAFETVNGQPVGRIHGVELLDFAPYPSPRPWPSATAAVDSRVFTIRVYPGLDFSCVDAALQAGNMRGLVIELYASATGPDVAGKRSLPAFVERSRELGIQVYCTLSAAPERSIRSYESGLAVVDAGAVFLPNVLTETAVVKLMWALAQGPTATTEQLMRSSVAGEGMLP